MPLPGLLARVNELCALSMASLGDLSILSGRSAYRFMTDISRDRLGLNLAVLLTQNGWTAAPQDHDTQPGQNVSICQPRRRFAVLVLDIVNSTSSPTRRTLDFQKATWCTNGNIPPVVRLSKPQCFVRKIIFRSSTSHRRGAYVTWMQSANHLRGIDPFFSQPSIQALKYGLSGGLSSSLQQFILSSLTHSHSHSHSRSSLLHNTLLLHL